MDQIRQGDVLIERALAISKFDMGDLGYRLLCDTNILARGEATGHDHMLATEEPFRIYEAENGVLYLHTEGKASVVHVDHPIPVELEPGDYLVTRQKNTLPSGRDKIAEARRANKFS